MTPHVLWLAAVLGCAILATCSTPVDAAVPPMIMVPGLTSSNLLVRRANYHSQYPFCKNNSGWCASALIRSRVYSVASDEYYTNRGQVAAVAAGAV